MSGERVVVDTSALIDYAKGAEAVASAFVGQEVHLSIITEIEFLAWPGMNEERQTDAHAFLKEYTTAGINDAIRDQAAWIRRNLKLKLPDAVIAAKALHLKAPLITRDKGFQKVAGRIV